MIQNDLQGDRIILKRSYARPHGGRETVLSLLFSWIVTSLRVQNLLILKEIKVIFKGKSICNDLRYN